MPKKRKGTAVAAKHGNKATPGKQVILDQELTSQDNHPPAYQVAEPPSDSTLNTFTYPKVPDAPYTSVLTTSSALQVGYGSAPYPSPLYHELEDLGSEGAKRVHSIEMEQTWVRPDSSSS